MPKVKVGVAWRRDGRNAAHAGDLAVFQHPGLADKVQVFTLAWAGADTATGLTKGELKDMDLLVIPGGPHANATQIPEAGAAPSNAPRAGSTAYAAERATSELDLIEQARTLGMPILALCGGSWRLVENYGGQTVELAALDHEGKILSSGRRDANRRRHAGNMDNVRTEFKHGAQIRPGSMLQSALAPKLGKAPARSSYTDPKHKTPETRPHGPTELNVNSVHWAAIRTGAMGTRTGVPARPYAIVPNNMLEMSAMDNSKLKTPEAVESRHGAPVMGVQWHPEYQLPVAGGEHPLSRLANLRLIQWMVEAGNAYRTHKDAMEELLGSKHADREAVKSSTVTNVTFAGANRTHTGATGRGPGASKITKHTDDTATDTFTMSEQAVRKYLFDRGRKGKLFLTPVELYNLAVGAPLSRFRVVAQPGEEQEPDTLTKAPVIAFMNSRPEFRKYCNAETKKVVLAWS